MMKERRELESQIGDDGRTCAGVAGRMRNSEDKRAVDHAEGKEIIDNTAYPEPGYRRPHSRRCSCNRISWMALNTTGEKSDMRRVTRVKRTRRRTLNLLGIGSASVVGIDLFRRGALVEGNKPLQKVVTSGVIVITAIIIREIISQR